MNSQVTAFTFSLLILARINSADDLTKLSHHLVGKPVNPKTRSIMETGDFRRDFDRAGGVTMRNQESHRRVKRWLWGWGFGWRRPWTVGYPYGIGGYPYGGFGYPYGGLGYPYGAIGYPYGLIGYPYGGLGMMYG
ncbi:sulfur globule protein CV3 domain protein [Teladorsagia circumcincta]|uniref:Sulfur globule protein CV3 domain protein n=1 Tax=Teladorsagia circumcincta TaxID=45464 RepID=A0A2G9UIP6_TELCI|nr:sulfur globule protein CV3 domain protein [Teladorsagia circumcincta]